MTPIPSPFSDKSSTLTPFSDKTPILTGNLQLFADVTDERNVQRWQASGIPAKLRATLKRGDGRPGAGSYAGKVIPNTLRFEHRLPCVAAASSSAGAGLTFLMRRLARGFAFVLVVGLLGGAWPAPVLAAGTSGDRSGGAPTQKADGETLTYDGFIGFNCSPNGFFTSATGHLNINGAVTVDGKSFLDGKLFDTYSLDLGTGPATFPTSFDRTFPTPAKSSYKFVFDSTVRRGKQTIGTSITAISCDVGNFAAVNAFVTPTDIPAGTPATLAALSLALAALGALALSRRRA